MPYFQVHQPFRLRRYTYFDIGVDARWFDDAENERIVRRVAERCYVPTNALLLRLVEETEGRFRCAFSVSGTAIEQMERWAPEALEGFVALARTGCVEVLGETSHHSLAFLADDLEFRAQVADQAARVERVFGRRPTAFRNTELVIDEHVARTVEDLGFVALLGEGSDGLLGWRSPARVYGVEGCERLRLLLRHYRLSDDIAFRFSNRAWDQWPLTAEKFARSLAALPADDVVVNLFMDYETFGEHQWKETGIFDFLAAMPRAVLADPRFAFRTPTEVATAHAPARGCRSPTRSRGPTPNATSARGSATRCSARPTSRSTRSCRWCDAAVAPTCTPRGAASRRRTTSTTCSRSGSRPTATCTSTSARTRRRTTRSSRS